MVADAARDAREGVRVEGDRQRAQELLYYDPTLEAQAPDGHLPLGRAYHAQARIVSSRSSWDPKCTTSVVYAKAGKEDYHCHADWGQVCIDGLGERLIVDLGSPRGGYPRTHKERYYNYQQWGHNVFVFGESETGGVTWNQRRQGKTTWAEFDDTRGAAWTMDLTDVYGDGRRVVRHVVHLLPRVAVVLDEAELPTSQQMSLRWHTIAPAEPDSEGHFLVRGKEAVLASGVVRLDGAADVRLGRQEHKPPFDKNRYGKPYRQPHEPFVEIRTEDSRCRILSLFCVLDAEQPPPQWRNTVDGWAIETRDGAVSVRVDAACLAVEAAGASRALRVRLAHPE